MAQQEEKEDIFKYEEGRRQQYKFGKGDIQFVTPNDYPSEDDYKKSEVTAELSLQHVYGYKGATNNARQNLFLCNNHLIYYIAAVGIVHNIADGTQKFFTLHNDDITAMDFEKKSGTVATAQKDPKDQPGQ